MGTHHPRHRAEDRIGKVPAARRHGPAAAEEAGPPRALGRTLGIFAAVAAAPEGLPLAELSAALGSPKSSLLALLRPLAEDGFLLHGAGRYRLGPEAFRLAAAMLAARRLPEQLRAAMEWLAERSGETVILTTIDREAGLVVYAECIDSRQPVRYVVPPGSTRPLYCSAAGRLLLAFQDETFREQYLETTPLRALTPLTVTDRAALRRILAQTRRDGISVTVGETVRGAAGCAAPVFDADGGVSRALLLGAPADRFEHEMPRLAALLREAAARASERGAGPPATFVPHRRKPANQAKGARAS